MTAHSSNPFTNARVVAQQRPGYRGPMPIPSNGDVYSDRQVMKSIKELEQRKYRQGERNSTMMNGDRVYVATEDDKFLCLPAEWQQQVREDTRKLAQLQLAADPFTLSVVVNELFYTVSIKGESYTKREVRREVVDSAKDPEAVLQQLVVDMRRELGAVARFREGEEMPVVVKDKRKRLPSKIPVCPDHGNELVPAESGVLKCPIPTCTKVLRRKTNGSAFKRLGETVPPAPVVEGLSDMIEKMDAKIAAAVVADTIDMGKLAEKFNVEVPYQPRPAPQVPFPGAQIELVQTSSGFAIRQGNQTIDVTGPGSYVEIKSSRLGLIEATVTLDVRFVTDPASSPMVNLG